MFLGRVGETGTLRAEFRVLDHPLGRRSIGSHQRLARQVRIVDRHGSSKVNSYPDPYFYAIIEIFDLIYFRLVFYVAIQGPNFVNLLDLGVRALKFIRLYI